MVSLATIASRITANAAAVATAIAGGTSTAEAAALGDLCLVLSQRPDLSLPPLLLGSLAKGNLSP